MKRGSRNQESMESAVSQTALKILNYLVEHPQASDTAEGIAQWWLLERVIIEEEELVQRALNDLVKQGLIIAWQSADARRHYRLNESQLAEIHQLIQDAE
jgi:hypothetical protein